MMTPAIRDRTRTLDSFSIDIIPVLKQIFSMDGRMDLMFKQGIRYVCRRVICI
jgi:hypothetical protein